MRSASTVRRVRDNRRRAPCRRLRAMAAAPIVSVLRIVPMALTRRHCRCNRMSPSSRNCLVTHRPTSVLPARRRAFGCARAQAGEFGERRGCDGSWASRSRRRAIGRVVFEGVAASGSAAVERRLQRPRRSRGTLRVVEHFLRGIDDRPVAGAAAQIAGKRGVDFLARRQAGVGGWFWYSAHIDMTKPGVQNPHCEPWQSTSACWTGCNAPSAARRSSTVISALPSSVGRNWMHALTALQRDVAVRVEFADHDRARAAVAFGAAFLGAGALLLSRRCWSTVRVAGASPISWTAPAGENGWFALS